MTGRTEVDRDFCVYTHRARRCLIFKVYFISLLGFQGSRRLRCTVFKVCKSGRCLIFKVRFFRCLIFKVYFISLFCFQGSLLFVVHFARFTFVSYSKLQKNQRTGSGKLSVLRFVGCERERYGPYMIMGWVPDYPFLGMLIR